MGNFSSQVRLQSHNLRLQSNYKIGHRTPLDILTLVCSFGRGKKRKNCLNLIRNFALDDEDVKNVLKEMVAILFN